MQLLSHSNESRYNINLLPLAITYIECKAIILIITTLARLKIDMNISDHDWAHLVDIGLAIRRVQIPPRLWVSVRL